MKTRLVRAQPTHEASRRKAQGKKTAIGKKKYKFLLVCCIGLLCDICKHVIKHAELVLSLFFKDVMFYFCQNLHESVVPVCVA